MTDQQKQHIINLRAEGKPYKEIAEELGLSHGCVKMFMSRRKREGERRKCAMCGKYLPKGARASHRFCSDKCKTDWWNRERARNRKPLPMGELIHIINTKPVWNERGKRI